MKNQLIFALGLLSIGILTGCGSVQNAVVIQDDLYDAPAQASVPQKKKTKANYLDFSDELTLKNCPILANKTCYKTSPTTNQQTR